MENRGQGTVAVFMAPGINDAGQAQKLRKKLKELDGVLEFDPNYILNTVSVRYDSDKVTLAQIRETIDAR